MNITSREEKIALIVMRGEPGHIGHTNIVFKAMMECDIVILMFGSSNAPISVKNPYKVAPRMNMWKMILGSDQKKIKYVAAPDINAVTKDEWCNSLFDILNKHKIPQPTHYYAGDKANASWYNETVNPYTNEKLEIVMVDRLKSGLMSGTDIRQCIIEGIDDWKDHVPSVIHNFVEENFPVFLKQEFKEKTTKLSRTFDDMRTEFQESGEIQFCEAYYKNISRFIHYIKKNRSNVKLKQLKSIEAFEEITKFFKSNFDVSKSPVIKIEDVVTLEDDLNNFLIETLEVNISEKSFH